jgi:hypothetical protein
MSGNVRPAKNRLNRKLAATPADKLTPENTRNHPIGGDDLNQAAQLRLKQDSFGADFCVVGDAGV